MSDDRLFDPTEFGVRDRPAKRGSKVTPEPTVIVTSKWIVLRHLKTPPHAHLRIFGAKPNHEGVLPGRCGVVSTPVSGLEGQRVIACAKCALLAGETI